MTLTYGSVCSGIEAASVAWEPVGMKPLWFSEIEPFPSAVLAAHWPQVDNLGDMTKIAAAVRAGDVPAPDLLVGGTPCQAFSVAGLRGGLSDERGQLTLSYVELADSIDEKREQNGEQPAIIVWENVPGVLSSKDNAFGCFLAGLAGESEELKPTGEKWTNVGYVSGPKRTVAWRILDAQYFGVAQRRRRVFVVASARTDICPAEILFEYDSLRGDITPGGEAAKGIAFSPESSIGKAGSHWDEKLNPHPTLNQSKNDGGIGLSNQELFSQRGAGLVSESQYGTEISGTLTARHDSSACVDRGMNIVSTYRQTAFGEYADDGTASTVKARDYKDATDLAVTYPHNTVRRLTPVECERLQGFPDNHTQISWRGKDAADCPDGPRYRAIGNSMAVPVMRWIGERILAALPVEETVPQVVSFSGGRTSAYLVHLMEQKRVSENLNVKYVFMDTGAEHPKTYEFIRNVVRQWNIDLVCLRLVVDPKLGNANSYRVMNVDEICADLQPWVDACGKYGTPYVHGAFCTRTMKLEPFERYCKENYPDGYHSWLGIRADEPRRLKPRDGVSYLADISDFDKQDILDWWREQPFDLDIPEHLGNCVFCIKKGINKIALAARDEPEMVAQFRDVITSDTVRVVERRQQENKIMYRGNNSLDSIIAMFSDQSRDDIAATIRGTGGYDSGSCSESCEALICDAVETPDLRSDYVIELEELRNKPAHMLKEVGDQWRTPDALYWGINAKFGPCTLDLFTDGQNSKCPNYYTAEDNALTQDWSEKLKELGGAAYGNPPYSRATYHDKQAVTGMVHIMEYAQAMREKGGRYIFLIKAATSETWWPEYADHVAFIRGRIGFDLPDWFVPANEKQKPSGAFFAGAVVILDKGWQGDKISYISRDELIAIGELFMQQAHWLVEKTGEAA